MALTPLIEALREKQEEKDEKVAKLKDLKANIKQEKKAQEDKGKAEEELLREIKA